MGRELDLRALAEESTRWLLGGVDPDVYPIPGTTPDPSDTGDRPSAAEPEAPALDD